MIRDALGEALSDAVRDAVRAEVAPILAEIAALREKLAAPRGDGLEYLSAILGKSAAAVRMVEARDPDLRALAVQVGKRRMYRREEVVTYLAGKARLRSISHPLKVVP